MSDKLENLISHVEPNLKNIAFTFQLDFELEEIKDVWFTDLDGIIREGKLLPIEDSHQAVLMFVDGKDGLEYFRKLQILGNVQLSTETSLLNQPEE